MNELAELEISVEYTEWAKVGIQYLVDEGGGGAEKKPEFKCGAPTRSICAMRR
jgi:hypothetical protein